MKLPRLAFQPHRVADFFEQGVGRLGAVCERTWHDRIDLLAEGAAAQLWSERGELQGVELHFPEADHARLPDPATEVFPGCPLTFRLAEMLWKQLPNESKIAVAGGVTSQKTPPPDVAEKTWRQQHPQSGRASFGPFLPAPHYTLVASLRCELQAIEQHWFTHRIALAWPLGERDGWMEHNLEQLDPLPAAAAHSTYWPTATPEVLRPLIERLVLEDLAPDLTSITVRQQHYLDRELRRIDTYFADYGRELQERAKRRRSAATAPPYQGRLEAAATEHARRRDDQVKRHEITIAPHLDALLWIAEPAWASPVHWREAHADRSHRAVYLPRLRRWFVER